MDSKKVCFVTAADQQIYVDQFNNRHKDFVERYGDTFFVYVSTNLPHKIDKLGNIKVFDLKELQKRHPETAICETVSENQTYTYRKYPWNTRRHIINKAFVDGYEYIVWTECDVHFRPSLEKFYDSLGSMKINTVYTFSTIWRYNDSPNNKVFCDYEKISSKLGIKIDNNFCNTHDGTNAIYYLDKKTQTNFIRDWDRIVEYRCNNNPKNGWIENMPYILCANNIGVECLGKGIFSIRHENDENNKKKGYGR